MHHPHTVRIAAPDAPGGHIVINESDLQPHHVLLDASAPEPAPAAPVKPAAKKAAKSKQP